MNTPESVLKIIRECYYSRIAAGSKGLRPDYVCNRRHGLPCVMMVGGDCNLYEDFDTGLRKNKRG